VTSDGWTRTMRLDETRVWCCVIVRPLSDNNFCLVLLDDRSAELYFAVIVPRHAMLHSVAVFLQRCATGNAQISHHPPTPSTTHSG